MYNNILVVVDLTNGGKQLLTRAKAMASDNATLTLLHVVEYMPLEPMGETVLPAMQMEDELVKRAKEKLAQLAAPYAIPTQQQLVNIGSIKVETQRIAQEQNIDLIIVGNHERHGLKALMNFTEDAVLHIAPCDVLAVHLVDQGPKSI